MKKKMDNGMDSYNSQSKKHIETMPHLSLPISCASTREDVSISLVSPQQKTIASSRTCLEILKKTNIESATTASTICMLYVPKPSAEKLELLGLAGDLDDLSI